MSRDAFFLTCLLKKTHVSFETVSLEERKSIQKMWNTMKFGAVPGSSHTHNPNFSQLWSTMETVIWQRDENLYVLRTWTD